MRTSPSSRRFSPDALRHGGRGRLLCADQSQQLGALGPGCVERLACEDAQRRCGQPHGGGCALALGSLVNSGSLRLSVAGVDPAPRQPSLAKEVVAHVNERDEGAVQGPDAGSPRVFDVRVDLFGRPGSAEEFDAGR